MPAALDFGSGFDECIQAKGQGPASSPPGVDKILSASVPM